jgi:hypothetical protein
MPHYSTSLASDAELANVYRWLNGKDDILIPAASLNLRMSEENSNSGGLNIEVKRADRESSNPSQYRVTLISNGKAAVSAQRLDYQFGSGTWANATTNARGEAMIPATSQGEDLHVRLPAPTARTVVVIEALAQPAAEKQPIVAVGSAILKPR